MPCEIISCNENDLKRAASLLSDGKLIAFPTETVYGLGGNVWIPEAVKNIFAVKCRPATDPLICHVDLLKKGLKLWAGGNEEDKNYTELRASVALATFIGSAFWPGPLTIVCKASASLPMEVTGGSGYVGLRIPNHPVALALLHQVDFAVAAPSANTFGHVSPISAAHVFDDLASRDPTLLIIDGGKSNVGIESTVIKIEDNASRIEMLRRGKITISDIKKVLGTHSLYRLVPIEVRDTRSKNNGSITASAITPSSSGIGAHPDADGKPGEPSLLLTANKKNSFSTSEPTEALKPMDGPGQLLTHYSPSIPSSLLTPSSFAFYQGRNTTTHHLLALSICREESESVPQDRGLQSAGSFPLSTTIVIDFNGLLQRAFHSTFLSTASELSDKEGSSSIRQSSCVQVKKELQSTGSFSTTVEAPASTSEKNLLDSCIAYTDLSTSGNVDEASSNLFHALRWSEKVPGGTNVVFPLLSTWSEVTLRSDVPDVTNTVNTQSDTKNVINYSEFLGAVDDRLFRAASGVVARVK